MRVVRNTFNLFTQSTFPFYNFCPGYFFAFKIEIQFDKRSVNNQLILFQVAKIPFSRSGGGGMVVDYPIAIFLAS
jgi:hypothetical protein